MTNSRNYSCKLAVRDSVKLFQYLFFLAGRFFLIYFIFIFAVYLRDVVCYYIRCKVDMSTGLWQGKYCFNTGGFILINPDYKFRLLWVHVGQYWGWDTFKERGVTQVRRWGVWWWVFGPKIMINIIIILINKFILWFLFWL